MFDDSKLKYYQYKNEKLEMFSYHLIIYMNFSRPFLSLLLALSAAQHAAVLAITFYYDDLCNEIYCRVTVV